METNWGEQLERIPAWIKMAVQVSRSDPNAAPHVPLFEKQLL